MTNESMALAVVETPIKPPPVYGEIKSNDFVKLKRAGLENAPDAEVPFWLIAGEGLFLHRRSILGRGITHRKYLPKFLPELGYKLGYFHYERDNIPEELCSQIVNFFRDVWNEHKTEAEVILLMNYETKEWAIHVPRQKVSGTSVESALDPNDIPEKYQIVGTMHSHCDFNAFHSGTDISDAEDMDGVHFTIGYLDKEEPQIVSMVMQDGIKFDYKPEQLGDFGSLEFPAPAEWMERIFTWQSEIAEADKEIFEKYGKKRTHTTTQPHKPSTNLPAYGTPSYPYGGLHGWDEDFWEAYQENRYSWYGNKDQEDAKKESSDDDIKKKASLNAPFWEDYLDNDLLDEIILSDIVTDNDMDEACAKPGQAQDINYWRGVFLMKIATSVNILYKMGMEVNYSARLVDSEKGKKKSPKEENPIEQKDIGNTEEMERSIVIDANLGLAYVEDNDLLPNDNYKTLADRLEDEGFKILEVRADGTVVLDVREQLGDEDDKTLEGDFVEVTVDKVLSGELTKISKVS